MILFVAVVMSGSLATGQAISPAPLTQESIPAPAVAPPAKNLPPPPPGKSTVMGGEIRNVDPVRDQFTLKVFGSNQTVKILYDERTQIYRNGQRLAVLDLKPDQHASIETTQDASQIFALRIHMLSQLPQGECQGQVLSYNPQRGELILNASLSREPIRLEVPSGVPVTRVGQNAFTSGPSGISDLMRGSLVDVNFEPGSSGHGVVTHINVLAIPGSTFTYSGVITSLDAHDKRLVIVDPRDNQSYQFSFDPSRFPNSRQLHEGAPVRVTASFNGGDYVASEITLQQ
jgi:hypothetical protein